ncbi:MAG: hypothetical protein EXR71_06975 [Myxococcales bacterium]|nr:hypothetical protein [Myxococcales bacterium]
MRQSVLALSSILFLVGCPEETVITLPPEEAKPIKLDSGEYSVLVVDVAVVECDGIAGQDLFGLQLPLILRQGKRGQATGDFAGLPVEGSHSGGTLFLEASEAPTVYGKINEGGSEGGGEDGEEAGAAESTRSDEGCDEPAEGEQGGGSTEDCDEGDDARPEPTPVDFELSIALAASRADHAEGTVSYRFDSCQLELQVVAQRIERGDELVPVYGEEKEEPPVPEEECGSEEDDCG